MSSGNPFRRSVVQDGSSVSPLVTQSGSGSGSSYGAYEVETESESEPDPKPKSKIKKHVRITSPPHSPEPSSPVVQHEENEQDYFPVASFSRITLQRRGSRSPPPPISPEEEALSLREQQASLGAEEESDSSTDDKELAQNTRRNSGSVEGGQTPTSPTRPNPFQRTLADIDPSAITSLDRESKQAQSKPSLLGRASLDVDSFKRLLMTGSAAPLSSGPFPPSPSKGLVPDNSSSTDTSSISHNSMFEAITEHNMESPRTSYELDLSDDDEQSSLIEEGPAVPKKDKKKKPPPPPKHKHGKGFSSPPATRAPQTVSFFDFKPSFSTSADGATTPPISAAAGTSPVIGITRTVSDLNKPLPPNPPMSPNPPVSVNPIPHSPEPIEAQSIPQEPLASPIFEKQKKTPPPPPITRRHSQLKSSSASTRSRSNSNLSTVSGPPPDLSISDHLPQLTKSPPPPPTRRVAPTTGTPLTPTINPTADSSPPNIDNLTRPSRSTSLGSHPPAPSDSMSPSSTPIPLEATPSKPPVSPPATRPSPTPSSNLTMAPPPPPPRRSNRRSLGSESPTESRRSSFEVQPRRPSGASVTSSLRREVGAINEEINEAAAEILDAQKALAEGQRRIAEAAGEGVGEKGEKGVVEVPGSGGGVDDFLKGLDDLQREVEEMQRRAKGVGG